MTSVSKEIGLIGLGAMGEKIATKLQENGYSLILYNRNNERYLPFQGDEKIQLSNTLEDFAKRLRTSEDSAIVWLMVKGGAVTNTFASQLSTLLRRNDIVIDASNSRYTDSIANYRELMSRGIFYLDVGCAGGPEDIAKGVSLMIGGDNIAFQRAEHIFKVVAGAGAYEHLGSPGSGHMAKAVHNLIFYGIFPVYAEGINALMVSQTEFSRFDLPAALRALSKAPPITIGIPEALAETAVRAAYEKPDSPQIGISEMVQWMAERANSSGINIGVIEEVLKDTL